ncbi:hypothetical protein GCM10010991_15500 [Gemmobacter aquaticus]|uniref:Uncharacterized protein n=2 Tax=Gemmobacter aquaticus TaxID=490185 RepID=A0A917YKR5_9RHOB|nr:hypothetical protein [Gemmobacter aquaticus]GGO30564.1 hypothetical protein GCM10010991_15500 [Gemmobacter aquaticus]
MIRTATTVAMCLLHCVLVFVAYDIRWESDLPTRVLISSAIMVNMIACLLLNFRYMRGVNSDASTKGRALEFAIFAAIFGLSVYSEIILLFVNETGIKGSLIPLFLFLALPAQMVYYAITLRKNRKHGSG